jgi:hypothetical protein
MNILGRMIDALRSWNDAARSGELIDAGKSRADAKPRRWIVRIGSDVVARYESLARRRPLIFSALTVAMLIGLVFLVLAPGFDTNDDPVLNMIVAGKGCCLAPDEHMVFTNVLLGLVLKSAYTWFPMLPWYGLYLLAIHFAAHTICLYCAVHDGYTRLRLRLFLCYFAVGAVVLVNNLQFTSVAYLAGQSAILLLILAIRFQAAGKKLSQTGGLMLLSLAFFALSSLIRREVFYPVFALGLVTVGIYACFQPNRRMHLLRCGAVLVLALVAAIGAWKFNDAYYDRDPSWREFYAYNKLRVKFNDSAWVYYAPETEHVFRKANWSKTDFAMLMGWFYDDENLYSLQAFNHIVDHYPWQKARITLANVTDGIKTVFFDRSSLAMFLVLPLLFWCVERTVGNYVLVGAALASAFGMMLFVIIVQKTPPSRVYLPTFAFPLALATCVARRSDSFLPSPELRNKVRLSIMRGRARQLVFDLELARAAMGILLVLLCAGVVVGNYHQYRRSRERLKKSDRLYEHIAALEPSPEKLFVCWAAAFPYEAMRTFDSMQSIADLRLLVVGWPQRTSHYRAMKDQFQIGDLAQAIFHRRDVHLIGDPYALELYQEYVREHYGAELVFDVCPETSLFMAVQASRAESEERQSERLAKPEKRDRRSG